MDPLYIFLAVLAIILLIMGLLVGFFQKRMMKLNLDNTLLLTRKIDVSDSKKIKELVDNECNIDIIKKPVLLKHSDEDELLDFIDDEIL